SQNPVQEWGEEVEEGAVYGVTLRREPVQPPEEGEAQSCFNFIQYRTTKVRRLKGATLDRLVTELLEPGDDADFAKIFLSTYRAFTDTNTFTELLFHRDDTTVDFDDNICQIYPKKSNLIPVIQTWLEEYSNDFRDPPHYPCLKLLRVRLRKRLCFRRLCQRVEALLKKFRGEETTKKHQATVGRPEAEWDGNEEVRDFLDFPPGDVAEQLTRLDAELFVKVLPFQCMGCVWSQRDKKENKHLAPTIRATIAQFNQVTNCVMGTLLCQGGAPRPCDRAQLIEKWINVAQECRQLKNFSSLRAILSALQSNAVYRLKRTWAAVCRDSITVFDNLCETFPDENCIPSCREIVEVRVASSESHPPFPLPRFSLLFPQSSSSVNVPYLGTYLTVLTMLDTALPDTLEGGLINFEKRRREFEILSQIRQLQSACSRYSLSHHPRIADWLKSHRLLSDQESYDLSCELEPPVDTCPGSPSSWSRRLMAKKVTSRLTVSEGCGKTNPDQISVSSSGSSGSDMEDLSSSSSSSYSPCRAKCKMLSSSCHDVAEEIFVPASSSSSSCSGSSGSNSQPDLSAVPRHLQHKRSVSMNSLPMYNRQVEDCCVIRVSVECSNGNLYKSILLTSQDKTAQVIQRALEKHNLESSGCQHFSLSQVISQDRELLIPDKANVFYAMCTTANYDFILRQHWRGHGTPQGSSTSPASQGRPGK
ncbi:RGL1 protein, partial [Amia calva]|nr:RGL1 protein [Amia calva]